MEVGLLFTGVALPLEAAQNHLEKDISAKQLKHNSTSWSKVTCINGGDGWSGSRHSTERGRAMELVVRKAVAALVVSVVVTLVRVEAQLVVGYYEQNGCPMAEEIVKKVLTAAVARDQSIAASLLRLHFHDCFVQVRDQLLPEFDTDPNLDAAYAGKLKQACPRNFDPRTVVPLDPVTPSQFDNRYYSNLVNNMGLMISDQTLHSDMLTQFSSESNAEDENMWQFKFANAMVRMGAINVKAEGEIRKNCRLRN
ncbi:peroxidase 5-like [Selaginella moellendorffii]|uniref:peroxidase 5-like n=1 Tax=Selaginella moellendorffii TaxID=88036 RepID=UPI000D1CD54D|nr:peroxidase 5-like [Selaginella moellendorffii]|eukprot:XP_024523671.1 peroxidase 5-like [Selaginella moellendorffii]